MENTSFENVTGLDDKVTNHVTSAYDIALMSRELLKHKKITEYTTIWMDTIRNGEFGLSNTNRLVKYYKGVTGLKTGFTSSAGFCISASAKRDNLHLIAVVMGAKTSNERNVCATKLLDFGFANYTVFLDKAREVGRIAIKDGVKEEMLVGCNDFELLENIGQDKRIITEYRYNDNISAPIKAGETVGKIIYRLDGKIIGESPIFAKETVEKMSFFHYFVEAVKKFVP